MQYHHYKTITVTVNNKQYRKKNAKTRTISATYPRLDTINCTITKHHVKNRPMFSIVLREFLLTTILSYRRTINSQDITSYRMLLNDL